MTDILDLIDNATQNRCACGCNTQLPEDGPSAWFASQDCQKRWSDRQAINPHEVYSRPEPSWSEADLEELGAPPRRRSAHLGAIVEMLAQVRLATSVPPPVMSRRRRRDPVVDPPRPGCRLALFVGGPLDGDVRAVPYREDYWVVLDEPPPARFVEETPADVWATPATVAYSARTVTMCLPPMYEFDLFERWEARLRVFATGNPSDHELMDAAGRALFAGWQPWLDGGHRG